MKWAGVLALPMLLLAATAQAQALNGGTVTLVTDGDTLWIRPDAGHGNAGKPRAFRLRGIDAPEICQPWGAQAKAALEARVLHRRVRLHSYATDDYRRSVATVEVDGVDIGAWMVGQGHAWNSRFGQSPGRYAAQEHAARIARRGLFARGDALEPHKFRKVHGPCR
ncbi:MAG: thermonuclease family protein [Burkholderiaceae bacterium]